MTTPMRAPRWIVNASSSRAVHGLLPHRVVVKQRDHGVDRASRRRQVGGGQAAEYHEFADDTVRAASVALTGCDDGEVGQERLAGVPTEVFRR
jgi:hypothetical protein